MKKIKGHNCFKRTRNKTFIRTGETRPPRIGDIFEIPNSDLAIECKEVDYPVTMSRHILKPYVPWYKKLFRRGE